MQNVST